MSLYIVGDIQGCFEPLKRLLDQVKFDPATDELWATGDLVNRGPQSLESLRFFQQLGDRTKIVLGNHDLHLLAVAYGVRNSKHGDTLNDILSAPDADELIQWLRIQPLLHVDATKKIILVHAGIPHIWSAKQAQIYANEVETALQSNAIHEFLQQMYGNEPNIWDEQLKSFDRLRIITNYFTRMRFCTQNGELDLGNKQGPETARPGFMPWFSFPPKIQDYRILFGHWASLEGKANAKHVTALDTGCVWGGNLSLLSWDDNQIHAVSCKTQLNKDS